MPDPVRSLYDLVAEAHARCPSLKTIHAWYAEHLELDDPAEVVAAWQCLEDALSAAAHGDYLAATRAAHFSSTFWSPDRQRTYPGKVYLEWGVWLEQFPAWSAFGEICELAWRIDCFLAALLREKIAGALARDCSQDLSLLLVLADWAAENGRPATAAEARHLHSLVRYRER